MMPFKRKLSPFRFDRLIHSILAKSEDKTWQAFSLHYQMQALKIATILLANYSRRSYHNQSHIEACLKHLDSIPKNQLPERDALELALWYHDVEEKEEQCADRAGRELKSLLKNDSLIENVKRLILATRHFIPSTIDVSQDEAFIKDIDLAILGSKKTVYEKYEADIRKEYPTVSDMDFINGRVKILETFYDRNPIYLTEFFRGRLEERAKENLAGTISKFKNWKEYLIRSVENP